MPPPPMAGVVACFTGIYGKLKSTLTEHIVTMGGVVQEGMVRSDRFDAPVKCTTVLVSERTNGPKINLARRLGLPVVNKDWVGHCFNEKQLLPYQPFLMPDVSSQDPEEVCISDDSDLDPDFVHVRQKRKTFSFDHHPPPRPAQKLKRKSADPPPPVLSNPFGVRVTNERGEDIDPDSLEGLKIVAKRGKRVGETN